MVFCVRLVSFLEAKAESLHRGAHHYTGVSPSFLGGRDLTSSSAFAVGVGFLGMCCIMKLVIVYVSLGLVTLSNLLYRLSKIPDLKLI